MLELKVKDEAFSEGTHNPTNREEIVTGYNKKHAELLKAIEIFSMG